MWRYPVKSLQGFQVDGAELTPKGFVGDRRWAMIDPETGKVLSAKRKAALLEGRATDEVLTLPDGEEIPLGDPRASELLSAWLGQDVELREAEGTSGLSYEMTFDPPDDTAELFDIPINPGTFLDLSPVHLITTGTLEGCARERPDLNWDVRRFRPNLVLDVDGDPFFEQEWVGKQVTVGQAVLDIAMPTVRCAMPLRAQPADGADAPLDRQPELFKALTAMNTASPNHFGLYATVDSPGAIAVGDPVTLAS